MRRRIEIGTKAWNHGGPRRDARKTRITSAAMPATRTTRCRFPADLDP